MRLDLHIHTCASPDSLTQPQQIIARAAQRTIDGLAITDHNTLEMAREMAHQPGLYIIVGEEISSREGELIGLFLHEIVPPGASAVDTARYIHEQGGLVMLQHPFDSLRHSAIRREALPLIIPSVDIIEALNARVIKRSMNALAVELARQYQKPTGAGSDAHLACEIGTAYVDIPPFHDRDSFKAALDRACICGGVSSPLVHIGSSLARLAKCIRHAYSLSGADRRCSL